MATEKIPHNSPVAALAEYSLVTSLPSMLHLAPKELARQRNLKGHHTKPPWELTGETDTTITKRAIVCSNCHRMLHRRSDVVVDKLPAIVQKKRRSSGPQ